MTIADLFVSVGFTPDIKSLDKAAAKAKTKFDSLSKGVSGIAAGVKGLVGLQALSMGIGAARSIASGFLEAANNADYLYRMAKRAKIPVEQLQKNQGKSVIMSKEEIDDLRNVKIFFAEINAWKTKIISGAFKMIAPYISKARAFLKGGSGKKIIETYKKFALQIVETAKPFFVALKGIIPVFIDGMEKIRGAVEPIYKLLGETASELFSSLEGGAANIVGVFSWVFDVLKEVVEAGAAVIKSAVVFLKGIFSSAWKNFGGIWKVAMSIVKMSINIIVNSLKMVANLVSGILRIAKPALDFIFKAVNKILYPFKVIFVIIEDILAIFDDSVDGYLEGLDGVKNMVAKAKAAKEWLENTAEKFISMVETFFNDLGGWIGDTYNETVAFWADVYKKSESWMKKTYDETIQWWSYTLAEMKNGFLESWETVRKSLDWAFEKVSKIKNVIMEAIGSLNSLKNIASKIPVIGSLFESKPEQAASGKAESKQAASVKPMEISREPSGAGLVAQRAFSAINGARDFSTAKIAASEMSFTQKPSETSNDNRKFSTVNNSRTEGNSTSNSTSNTNITVNVHGNGDKKEITKAVELGINQSKLANMRQ